MGQTGFWDLAQRHQELAAKNSTLADLDQLIPWESFRAQLEVIHDKPRKRKAGRKPMAVVMLFKLLVLQQLYNISDTALAYQVKDQLSFMRFLGLSCCAFKLR